MIYLFTHVIVYFVGVATGMYFVSQIEKEINNNTNKKNGTTNRKGKG